MVKDSWQLVLVKVFFSFHGYFLKVDFQIDFKLFLIKTFLVYTNMSSLWGSRDQLIKEKKKLKGQKSWHVSPFLNSHRGTYFTHPPPTLSGKAISLLLFLQKQERGVKKQEPGIEYERKASLNVTHRWYHSAGVIGDHWGIWNKKPADRRLARLDGKYSSQKAGGR